MGITAAPAPPRPSHADGYRLFQQITQALCQMGWRYKRVDTMEHPQHVWTIRHHYCHEEWEWYYEPDRYWYPQGEVGMLVRVRLARPPLPTVKQVLRELLTADRYDKDLQTAKLAATRNGHQS